MRFNVPKFIDIEDKIFGPLTFKQFVYLVGGAGLSVLVWWSLPNIFALPLIGVVIAFSLALAFYRVNKKPFIYIVQSALQYLTNARLYVWKQRKHPDKSSERLKKEAEQIKKAVPDTSGENLKRKSWEIQVRKDENKPNSESELELHKSVSGPKTDL